MRIYAQFQTSNRVFVFCCVRGVEVNAKGELDGWLSHRNGPWFEVVFASCDKGAAWSLVAGVGQQGKGLRARFEPTRRLVIQAAFAAQSERGNGSFWQIIALPLALFALFFNLTNLIALKLPLVHNLKWLNYLSISF